jgi:hypothetical protein
MNRHTVGPGALGAQYLRYPVGQPGGWAFTHIHQFTCWYSDAGNMVPSANHVAGCNRALRGVATCRWHMPAAMDETLALLPVMRKARAWSGLPVE